MDTLGFEMIVPQLASSGMMVPASHAARFWVIILWAVGSAKKSP